VTTERTSDRFRVGVSLIAFGGLAMRIVYVTVAGSAIGGDGRYYHAIASLLADGKGFIAPRPYLLSGKIIDFAPHPPAWPLTLAGGALVGLRSIYEQQLVACLIGTATIVVIAFAGRRIAGETAGIAAAGIAAVYPNFWLHERELMSETLTLFGTSLTILLAYRFLARPSRGRAVALGFSCGLVALTHAEQLLLVGLLLVPIILLTRDQPLRRRFAWAALATGAVIVSILPWAVYNTARFDTPVLLGTELGVTVAVTNCQYTYSGEYLGFQSEKCAVVARATGRITGRDKSTRDSQYLDVGIDYARDHLSRLPAVVAAREGRLWSVFRVGHQMRMDALRRTSPRVIKAGFFSYWALLPAAILGGVALRRRGVTRLPLLALIVTVSIGAAITYGSTRFRASAEVAIVLLAAVGLDALLRRRARQRRASAG
jgi:4-amino-4-deoxy-L-arabinose transferase-like glycosyltransferase